MQILTIDVEHNTFERVRNRAHTSKQNKGRHWSLVVFGTYAVHQVRKSLVILLTVRGSVCNPPAHVKISIPNLYKRKHKYAS
jgi:hypothetical protein